VTIKITLIGMGQVGTSIGLALASQKDAFVRVGNDKDIKVANRAKELGALDRVEFNLPKAVADAAIVILAIPLDQIRETLQFIAHDLKEEAIVMDTAPVKANVLQWAGELLPPHRYYIGLVPVLNPAYLDVSTTGVEAARADLFKNGLMAILSPGEVPSEAIKLATDFASLLGASHLFIDPIELDSMMANIHILPQLLSAALLNSTVDRPGWYDARKLTGWPYAQVSSAVEASAEAGSLASQALAAQVPLVNHLDNFIATLQALREQLVGGEAEKLRQELDKARTGRDQWLKERTAGSWIPAENVPNMVLPTARQEFKRMFTFGGGRKPKQPK
jgi:prephenate dehydrogenase